MTDQPHPPSTHPPDPDDGQHRLRIHWSFGMGPYYGPESAPTLLVLVAGQLGLIAANL